MTAIRRFDKCSVHYRAKCLQLRYVPLTEVHVLCFFLQEGLHTWLWRCRYASMLAASLVYVWEWLNHCDWAKRNSQTLSEIQSQNELIMGALGLPTPQQRRASGPSLGQRFRRVPTPSSPRHSWPRATGEVTPSLPQHEVRVEQLVMYSVCLAKSS